MRPLLRQLGAEVRDVPYALVEQTRPGGAIVLPYMPMPGQWGLQLRLDVLDDGTAMGTFHGDCGFMMLRAQRRTNWPPYPGGGTKSTTRVDPRGPWTALDRGFGLHLAATVPDLVITTAGPELDGDGAAAWVMRLRHLTRPDAWALVTARPGEDTQVSQSESRQLWNALEDAFMEWLRAGRPGRDQYRMLVTPGGQDVWLP